MVAEARARLSLDGKPFQQELEGIGKQVSGKFSDTLKNAGRLIAGAFTVRAVTQFAQETLRIADNIDNLSKKLGLSAETVQSLEVVSKQTGIEFTKFESAILKVSKGAEQAKSGNDQMVKSFQALGISIADLQGMTPEQVFERIAQAMAANQGDANTLSNAYRLLGDEAGPALKAAMIDLGNEGFGALNKRMRETGEILSDEVVAKVDIAEEKIRSVTAASKNALMDFVGSAIAALDEFVTGATAETDMAAREMQRLVDDLAAKAEAHRAEAQKQVEAENALLQETIALNQKKNDILEASLPVHIKVREARGLVAELERKLAAVEGESMQARQTRLALENRIIDARQDLKSKEAELAKLESDAAKERLREQDAIRRARNQYDQDVLKHQYEQMDLVGKIEQRERDRAAALWYIAELEKKGKGETVEMWEAKRHLLKIEQEIAGLNKDQADELERGRDGVKETEQAFLDLDKTQTDVLESLREMFREMNDKELGEFIAGIRKLAVELANLPNVNLQWLRDLSNFKMPNFSTSQAEQIARSLREFIRILENVPNPNFAWLDDLKALGGITLPNFTQGQARQVARAIREFIQELDAIGQPNMGWLDDLKALKNIELPGFTSGQARDAARAIKDLVDGLAGINDIDLAKLEMAVQLIDALGKAGPGGQYDLDITMPEGFENGIPLVVPDSFESTLNEISGSLRTLANLKGIAWY